MSAPGVNLVERRLNRGYSIRRLASEIDVPEQSIRRAESGKGVTPENALKIATFHDLKVTDIWPLEDPNPATAAA